MNERHPYYDSPEWKELCRQVKLREKNVCRRCRFFAMACTHHLTYARWKHEELTDLEGRCKGCHDYITGYALEDPIEQIKTWTPEAYAQQWAQEAECNPARDAFRAMPPTKAMWQAQVVRGGPALWEMRFDVEWSVRDKYLRELDAEIDTEQSVRAKHLRGVNPEVTGGYTVARAELLSADDSGYREAVVRAEQERLFADLPAPRLGRYGGPRHKIS